MNRLWNLARVTTATTGTGTITLGAAVPSFLTFAQAGALSGDVVTYGIEDGLNSEVGQGTYTAAGTTLTRDVVYRSTGAANTGKITLSGTAEVYITMAAEDIDEPSRTNSIRNNSMQGAVAGTPGTLCTNWIQNINGALTRQIIGTGQSQGMDYIDVRISGTISSTGNQNIWNPFFEANNQIAASTGQTWTNSVFIAIVGGTSTNITSCSVGWNENTSAGGFVAGHGGTNIVASLTATLTRFSTTVTNSGGGTVAAVHPYISTQGPGGSAVDFTLRIAWPQMELGAFATTPIRTTTVAVTRLSDVVRRTSPSTYPQTRLLSDLIASMSDVPGSTGTGNLVLSNSPTISGTTTFTATPNTPVLLGSASLANTPVRHLAVSGNYAYCSSNGTVQGFEIFDVTILTAPVKIGGCDLPGAAVGHVVVAGQYAYVSVNLSGNPVQIIDVSNPKSPTIVGALTTAVLGAAIAVSGNYLYLGQGGASAVLRIYDVTNPAITTSASLSSVSLTGASGLRDIVLQGKYAFVTSGQAVAGTGGFYVVDVSDPTTPTLISTYNATGATSVNGLVVDGKYAYLAGTPAANGLEVVDVSDPTTPVRVGSVFTTTQAAVQVGGSLVKAGNYLYYPGATSLIQIIDITNPAAPSSVTTVSSVTAAQGLVVNGRYMYVTANQQIRIYDLLSAQFSSLSAGSIDVGHLYVDRKAYFNDDIQSQRGLIVGQAGINSRGPVTASTLSATTLTSGSVLFAGSTGLISQNNNSLFWDNTNERFGIGTGSPITSLDVEGTFNVLYAANAMSTGMRATISNKDTTDNNFSRLNFSTIDLGAALRNGAGITAVFLSHAANAVTADLVIQTSAVGTHAERARFNASGITSAASVILAGTGLVSWTARGTITSPADSQILMTNDAGTDFGLLKFGGTSASFPALKRSTTTLQVRLANDTGYAPLETGDIGIGGTPTSRFVISGYNSSMASGFSSSVNTGAGFGVGGFGFNVIRTGTTSAWVLGTDTAANGGGFIDSTVGGVLRFFAVPSTGGTTKTLTDAQMMATSVAALSSAGILALGPGAGLSASFPALKRSTTTLQVRLADDTGYATLDALSVLDSGTAPTGTAGSGYVRATSPTISGATISGTTTLTGMTAGSILFAGASNVLSQNNANLFWDNTSIALGIGVANPTARLQIAGTYTTANSIVVAVGGALASSALSNQKGLAVFSSFSPSGASLSSLVGADIQPTLAGSAFTVSSFNAVSAALLTSAGYTGTITNATIFSAGSPAITGTGTITNFYQFLANGHSFNNALAAGSAFNVGLLVGGVTSGVAGGTLHNRGVQISVPSGTAPASGTVNNRGIYITGNGGAAPGGTGVVSNFAIFSDSTAPSSLAGNLSISGPTYATFFVKGYTTIVTAAGTTVLTAASNQQQFFTGTTTQTVTLPVTSTMTLGQEFFINNNSTGAVTVNSSGGNVVLVLAGNTSAIFTVILITGTTAASWDALYRANIVASGKAPTFNNTLTFAGTDGSTLNIGTGGTLGTNAYTSTAYAPLAGPTFTGVVTIPTPFTLGATSVTTTGTQLNYLNAATGTTGTTSTNIVFSTSPVLVTPLLGTPTSGVLTNCTGLPIGSVTGLGTNVATFLGTPSSANLIAAVTDETGTGALVFANTPTLVTPNIGAATGTSLVTTGAVQAGTTLSVGATAVAVLDVAADRSNAFWGVNGLGLRIRAATYTDTSSTGSVLGDLGIHGILLPTITTSSIVTYANVATLRIVGAPIAGTNVTITNAYAFQVGAGDSRFGGNLVLDGSTSGKLTIKVPAAVGANTLTLPAGTTDFSATGGAGQVVRQTSVGGALTVGAVAVGEVSGLAAGVATFLGTPSSANLRAALTDESGTGVAYFQGGDLGTPSAGILTNCTVNLAQSAPVLLGTGTLAAASRSVAVVGNYAYTTNQATTPAHCIEIWDITVPTTPVKIGGLDLGGTLGALGTPIVAGQILYVGYNSTSGIQIVDVSNPKTPTLLRSVTVAAQGAVAVSGGYLYAGQNFTTSNLRIYDISDPSNPILRSTTALTGSTNIQAITIQGKYLYAACTQTVAGTGGMNVVDISDPVTPVIIATYNTVNNARGILAAGKYLYVTEQVTTSGLEVVDISDPAAPVQVSVFATTAQGSGGATPVMVGKYLYFWGAAGAGGVQIIDISNPAVPISAQVVNTVAAGLGGAVSGNRLYISANAQLRVYDTLGVDTPTIKAGSLNTDNLYVDGPSYFAGDMYTQRGLVVGQGGIFSRGPLICDASEAAIPISAILGKGLVCIGGSDNTFPALKRNATVLEHRLADDSAYGPMAASVGTFYGTTAAQAMQLTTNASYGRVASVSGSTGFLLAPNDQGTNCAFRLTSSTTTATMAATDSVGNVAFKTLTFDGTDIAFNTSGSAKMNLLAGGRLQIGAANTGNAATSLQVTQPSDGSGVIIARGVATPIELWLGVNQTGLYADIQVAQGGVGFTSTQLLLNRQGGNVGIRTPTLLPQAMLQVGETAGDFRVYNTFTSATVGEWFEIDWLSNVAVIGTNKGSGGGVARDVSLEYGGTEQIRLAAAGTTITGPLGIGAAPVAVFDIRTAAMSSAAWGLNAPGFRQRNATYTDTSSSGTVADAMIDTILTQTLAASNVTTFTRATTLYVTAPAPGTNVTITNPIAILCGGNLQVDGLVKFAGNTSAFPALKRSTTTIQVRLADDSAYGTLDALSILDSGTAPTGTAGTGYVRATSPTLVTPNIGAASATSVTATGNITAGATGIQNWTGRSQISSPADSQILITNAAVNDFARLMLGGTTASFPAIKRSTTRAQFRLADDSAFTGLDISDLSVAGANGQSLNNLLLTEAPTTIAAAATSTTTMQIPARSLVLGVTVRVTVAIPTAATFTVGVTGAAARYGTGIAVALNTTFNSPPTDNIFYYAAATPILITPNLTPGTNVGRVRVTIHYMTFTPPTS